MPEPQAPCVPLLLLSFRLAAQMPICSGGPHLERHGCRNLLLNILLLVLGRGPADQIGMPPMRYAVRLNLKSFTQHDCCRTGSSCFHDAIYARIVDVGAADLPQFFARRTTSAICRRLQSTCLRILVGYKGGCPYAPFGLGEVS